MAATPPSPARRKARMLRAGDAPDDLMLVIRSTPTSRSAAVADIARDAEVSARIYVVEGAEGIREVLYGVSVIGRRLGTDPAEVLRRFPFAPAYVETTVGVIRNAGFTVLPTGSDPAHFDVQLLGGISEGSHFGSTARIRAVAVRLLEAAGDLRPNPSYALGTDDPSEEER